MIDCFWTHALILDETYEAILSTCNFTIGNFSEECDIAIISAYMEIGNIDNYDIYASICHINPKTKITRSLVWLVFATLTNVI